MCPWVWENSYPFQEYAGEWNRRAEHRWARTESIWNKDGMNMNHAGDAGGREERGPVTIWSELPTNRGIHWQTRGKLWWYNNFALFCPLHDISGKQGIFLQLAENFFQVEKSCFPKLSSFHSGLIGSSKYLLVFWASERVYN